MIGQIVFCIMVFFMALFFGAYVDQITGGKHGRNIGNKINRAYKYTRGHLVGRRRPGAVQRGQTFIKLK